MSTLTTAPTTDAQPIRPSAFLYPLGLWMLMAVVAIVNGVCRETTLIPRVGQYIGHVISTALLASAILLISYLYFDNTDTEYTRTELLLIGVVWTGLTIGFEFLIGYIEDTPIEVTLAQYNVLAGQVWIIVPLALLTAPLFFGSRQS